MNNEIESSTYQTWFKKFKEDKAILESSINGNQKSKALNNENIKERLMPYMSKLYDIYDKGNIVQKQTLIRGVFKDNLTCGEGAFRTAFIRINAKSCGAGMIFLLLRINLS